MARSAAGGASSPTAAGVGDARGVYFSPAIIAIASVRIFGECLRPAGLAGIALSIAGIAVMSGFEPDMTGEMLLGDLF
ncbi:MAG: hypothetical protein HN380_03175, partial [Victivallales bacterium]|nr:hypothetical protein [Victivallales bacterium]